MPLQQPWATVADVHRLENAITAEEAKIVRMQQRSVPRYNADPENSDHLMISHVGSVARRITNRI